MYRFQISKVMLEHLAIMQRFPQDYGAYKNTFAIIDHMTMTILVWKSQPR